MFYRPRRRHGLSPAKGPVYILLRSSRYGVPLQLRPILVGPRNSLQQLLEWLQIATFRSLNHRLYAMIARNKRWIHRTHPGSPFRRLHRLLRQPRMPPRSPCVIGRRIGKQASHAIIPKARGSIAKPTKGQRKVSCIDRHALQQILRQRRIALLLGPESQLQLQPGVPSHLELRPKRAQSLPGSGLRGLFTALLALQQWQQRLRQTR